MIETLREAHGVGLAAPQVGRLQRLAVLQLPDEEEPRVLVNPEITRREGERQVEEGCQAQWQNARAIWHLEARLLSC